MAGARSFDDKRARILALGSAPANEARAELPKYLADKNGYLVGEAAEAVKTQELTELVPDLAAAFMRLLEDPVKSDKGCFGKNRVVEALLAFDAHEPDVYLAGLRHRQVEGAPPFSVDTATGLRGMCARALFHIHHPPALLEVAPMLFDDKEPSARAEAAAALGESGLDGAAAVLHVKSLIGDPEADVMGEVYKGLLRILPQRYMPLVEEALREGGDPTVEAAALALGEARVQGAFEALRRGWERHCGGRAAEGVLLGIALLRSDQANGFLVSLVERAPEQDAALALSALALHRHDEALVGRLEAIVPGRKSRRLAEVFAEKFRV
jgi:HEAT repeat protein